MGAPSTGSQLRQDATQDAKGLASFEPGQHPVSQDAGPNDYKLERSTESNCWALQDAGLVYSSLGSWVASCLSNIRFQIMGSYRNTHSLFFCY